MNNCIDLRITCNIARWYDQMLKMISFIYFLRQIISSLSREKKIPQPSCKSFSYRLERSFHFSYAIFAFKASLVCFTFSRIFKGHKNFPCWIYFSSNSFASCFRWGTIRNNLVQNWKCQWGKNVSVRKQFSKISWKTEQVSCLSE